MKNKQYTKTKNKIYGKPKKGIAAGELRAAQLAMETAINAVQMAFTLSRPIPKCDNGCNFNPKIQGIIYPESGREMIFKANQDGVFDVKISLNKGESIYKHNVTDTNGDIIIPGAFDKSMSECKFELKDHDLLHSIKMLSKP